MSIYEADDHLRAIAAVFAQVIKSAAGDQEAGGDRVRGCDRGAYRVTPPWPPPLRRGGAMCYLKAQDS